MIFRKKPPKPQYKVGEFAMIPSRPGAKKPIVRYMIIRSREWIKLDAEWVYDGIVVLSISSDGVIVVRQYVRGISEGKLCKVRGGDLGLPAE